MVLNRRVEVLFAEGEYEELRREAERKGVSFGEFIRDAMRRQYIAPSEERRRRAVEWFSTQQIDIDWEEAKGLVGRYVDKEPDP